MAAPSANAALQRAYYAIGILVFVAVILYWGKVVLVPLSLAILLAFVLNPAVLRLERHGLNRIWSVSLTTLAAFAIIFGIFYLAGAEIGRLAGDLPKYETNINRKLASVYSFVERLQQFEKLGHQEKKPVPLDAPKDEHGKAKEPTPVVIQPRESILNWIPSLALPVVETGAQTFLVVVLAVFILFQRENLRDRLIRLIGRRYLTSTTKAMGDAAERVSRYLLLQLATNTAIGVCVAVGLFFIGVPYALLWGVLALTLRFIPYAGIWLAASLPLMLSIATAPDWGQPLLVLALFLVLEFVTGNIVEPNLFGHGTGVGALALLVAAAFWAWLWGPIGLLLSAPLTVLLVVMGKYVPGLKFLDVLLGDEPVLGPAARYYQRLLARDRDEAEMVVEEHMRTHAPEAIYDEVLLPALVRARGDRAANDITSEEEQYVVQTTGELLDEYLAHVGPVKPEAVGVEPRSGPARTEPERLSVHVIGCAARGEIDELALKMLELVLQPLGAEVTLLPRKVVLGEAKGAAAPPAPDVFCVADLPPGGLTEARHLCRRLRALYPEARILVGRWGEHDDVEGAQQYLTAAGADATAVSLLETRRHLLEGAEGKAPARREEPVAAGS